MSKYLLKATEYYRVDTVSEVEDFHKELKSDGAFTLDSFGYKQKEVKEKGEVVDEYCYVTVKKVFTDEKYPSVQLEPKYEKNEF